MVNPLARLTMVGVWETDESGMEDNIEIVLLIKSVSDILVKCIGFNQIDSYST